MMNAGWNKKLQGCINILIRGLTEIHIASKKKPQFDKQRLQLKKVPIIEGSGIVRKRNLQHHHQFLSSTIGRWFYSGWKRFRHELLYQQFPGQYQGLCVCSGLYYQWLL